MKEKKEKTLEDKKAREKVLAGFAEPEPKKPLPVKKPKVKQGKLAVAEKS